MIRIVKATQTSFTGFSQWDAWTSDGEYIYLRYRYGRGSAIIFRDPNWYPYDKLRQPITTFDTGNELDGFISLEDFCTRAGFELMLDDMPEEAVG